MLAYELLEVKDYLSNVITSPILPFVLQEVHEYLASLAINLQSELDKNNLRDEVHISVSYFNALQEHAFNKFFGTILPCITASTAVDNLPTAFAAFHRLKIPLLHNPTSFSPYNLIHSPSLFLPSSSSSSPLFLLDAFCGTFQARCWLQELSRAFYNYKTRKYCACHVSSRSSASL